MHIRARDGVVHVFRYLNVNASPPRKAASCRTHRLDNNFAVHAGHCNHKQSGENGLPQECDFEAGPHCAVSRPDQVLPSFGCIYVHECEATPCGALGPNVGTQAGLWQGAISQNSISFQILVTV